MKGHKLGTVTSFNPVALRIAKTLWSFGCSECNRVKYLAAIDTDEGSKLPRIAQAIAALTKLMPIWIENNKSLGFKVQLMLHFYTPVSHRP